MNYSFSSEDKEIIIEKFGNDFFKSVDGLKSPLTLRWDIGEVEIISSFSSNLVFKCFSETHGNVVMKFGRNYDEFTSEVNALNYFSRRGTCELIDVDYNNLVLLEEAVFPGNELVLENQIEDRISVFCELYKQLHMGNDKRIKSMDNQNQDFKYKTYSEWILRITSYIQQQEHWKEVSIHMEEAKELYLELSEEYSTESLLHGDFHYYNILKSKDDYKIIDPKGVIGNPIFDIPRYMLNEFWDEKDSSKVDETIELVFSIISEKLNVSRAVLSKLLYIEGVMAICWCIESGANIKEKISFLEMIEKLTKYMC